MKILVIGSDPSIFTEGSASRLRQKAYAEAIGELHILSRGKGSEVHDGALHLYPIPGSRLFTFFGLARRAHSLVLQKNIEIVSAQDPFEHGLAALKAVKGTNAKLHIQIHTDFLSPWYIRGGNWRSPRVHMPLLNRFRRRWADKVLPQAHGIRVVSERVAHSLAIRYGSRISPPSVIPIAVDANVPPRAFLPTRPFTFTLIAVSRLESEKRIEDILAALALVVPHYPVAGLCIVGEGSERPRLERMVHKLGLQQNVLFLGARADARGLMQSAQAFIQASAYEGYGLTLIEAALAKIPIITTDVGIVGEVFKGYEDVLAAPVADPTALSLHIVGIIEDTGVRQELPIHAEAAARAHLASVGDLPTRIRDDFARLLG